MYKESEECSTTSPSPVFSALANLEKMVGMLENRLAPVLTQNQSDSGPSLKRISEPNLGERLADVAKLVERILSQLEI